MANCYSLRPSGKLGRRDQAVVIPRRGGDHRMVAAGGVAMAVAEAMVVVLIHLGQDPHQMFQMP